jgi:ribosomal protein S18 acetylase RimI-like enzyme
MISTRLATTEDSGAVATLFDAYRVFYGRSSDLTLARRFIAERLARNESTIILAFGNSTGPLGFTQLYPSFSSVRAARIYVLNDLYVRPDARRSGVGKLLLGAAAEFGKEQGAARLVLSTAVTNKSAQQLYESMGWARDDGFVEYALSL